MTILSKEEILDKATPVVMTITLGDPSHFIPEGEVFWSMDKYAEQQAI